MVSKTSFPSVRYGVANVFKLSVVIVQHILYAIDLIHERVIVRLHHSLPDGKLQKKGRALYFTAGLL